MMQRIKIVMQRRWASPPASLMTGSMGASQYGENGKMNRDGKKHRIVRWSVPSVGAMRRPVGGP
jgi:hypothetical protein